MRYEVTFSPYKRNIPCPKKYNIFLIVYLKRNKKIRLFRFIHFNPNGIFFILFTADSGY